MALKSVWILVSCLLFVLVAFFCKIAAPHYGLWEIVMYRSAVGSVLVTALLVRSGVSPLTRYPWRHLRRCVTGSVTFAVEVSALSMLPLGPVPELQQLAHFHGVPDRGGSGGPPQA